jgi:hypothetical protein
MNKLICVAAVSILASACASAPTASTSNGGATASVAGERYCFKRNLTEGDGKLHCNWVADRSQVCNSARVYETVEIGRYSAPQPSGRCETGEYIVKVAPKA